MFHDELLDLFGAMRHTGSSLDYKINPYGDDADSANFGGVADLFNFIFEERSVKKLAVISSQPQHCEEAPQVEGMKTVFEVREYRVIPANQPRPKAIEKGSEDEEFIIACNNPNLTINPRKLGFIPKHFWPDRDQTLGNIHEDFFKRKNHQCCRIRHKLFNAIKLGEACPHLGKFVGIEWVSSNILRIDKHRFGRLLGINSVEGGLFHRQGNFSTHAFIDSPIEMVRSIYGPDAVIPSEHDSYKLLIYSKGVFVRGVTEQQIENCRWVSWRKR